MKKIFTIERMSRSEVDLAIDWAAKEGWNPGLQDAECFYAADPNSFFAGKLGDEIIVLGSAVIYDENFAFCGLYITKPSYRSEGYGIQLTKARLDYVGNRITGIDGVINMMHKYENIGYVYAHKNVRYWSEEQFSFVTANEIIDLKKFSFEKIKMFDRHYFPAERDRFLTCWINQPNAFALGYVENNSLLGYGVIRKCRTGFKLGPLFASSDKVADALFKALVSKAHPPYYLDVPDANLDGQSLVKKYGMTEVFATARMYRNGQPKIDLSGVFGITTFELG